MIDIERKINDAKAELAMLEAGRARIKSLPQDFRVAELLHEQFCNTNHNCDCGWEYTTWAEYSMRSTRHKWLVKARALLSQFTEDSIEIFITHLKRDGLH